MTQEPYYSSRQPWATWFLQLLPGNYLTGFGHLVLRDLSKEGMACSLNLHFISILTVYFTAMIYFRSSPPRNSIRQILSSPRMFSGIVAVYLHCSLRFGEDDRVQCSNYDEILGSCWKGTTLFRGCVWIRKLMIGDLVFQFTYKNYSSCTIQSQLQCKDFQTGIFVSVTESSENWIEGSSWKFLTCSFVFHFKRWKS